MGHKIYQQHPVWVVILVLLGSVACEKDVTFITTRSSLALGYYQTGLAHLTDAEYPAAIQNFEEAIRVDPLFRMGYCRLSMAYHRLGNQNKAIECNYLATKEILMINTEEQGFINWWDAYLHQRPHEALVSLEQLHKKIPFNKELQIYLAESLVENQLVSTAREIYNEILLVEQDYLPALLGLGKLHFRMENLDSAQFWFEKALEAAPQKPVTHLKIGKFFFANGQYEPALLELKQCSALSPEIPESYFQLALLFKDLGDYQQALDFFQQYRRQKHIGQHSLSVACCAEAEIHYFMNDLALTAQKCNEAIELDANNLQAYYWLGRTYLTENRFDEAFALANQMKLLATRKSQLSRVEKAWYHRFMSQVYLDQGEYEPALVEASAAVQVAPSLNELEFLVFTAKVLLASGDWGRAIGVCQSIFQKNPWYPPAHLLLAEILEQQGNSSLARKHYQTVVKLYQNADDISPLQKARTRLAILGSKPKSAIKLTRFAEE